MATSLALRFRSNLIRTATLLRPPPLPKPSHPLFSSLSITSPIPLDPPSWFCLSSHRFLSTSRRHPSSRPKKTVDIAARARQLQTRRLWTYALTFATIAGFIVVVLNTFQDQLVFYVTPTDAIKKFEENPTKAKFKLGGLVLEGSVVYPSSSPDIEFVVTDLITDIVVRYQGALPDLFREGNSIVTEGFMKPFTDEIKNDTSVRNVAAKARSGEYYFSATEVYAKHDEKYMPPEVAAAIEKNKKIIEEANGANKEKANEEKADNNAS
jgi:cytochrome c-type biogenesis protein CcmE